MNIDECHEILWNHFAYEFESHYGECGLDEFSESYNGTKRDYIIDAFDWLPEGLANEDADRDSVDYVCYLWVNKMYEG